MSAMFITGAGGGIGRALVDRALARGDRVIAGVFSEREAAGFPRQANLYVISVDVSQSESVDAGFGEIDRWLNGAPLDVVVNCAATCPLGALEVQSTDVIRDVLNTNAVGSARLLQAALPRLRGHGGRIALVTSLWGRVAGPMLSAYCASKFAIEAIADAARREIEGQDVSVILIEPGVVRTSMVQTQVEGARLAAKNLTGDHATVYGSLYRKYHAMIDKNSGGGVSAEECARQIEAAVFARKPKTRYRVGMDSKAVTMLARLLPDRALDSMFKMLLR